MDINVGKDYVSPHRTPYDADPHPYEKGPHHHWYDAREEYARAEVGPNGEGDRERAMAEMLSHVTEKNPPRERAPLAPPARARTRTWHDIDGRPHEYVRVQLHWERRVSPRLALALGALWCLLLALVLAGVI
jgi:hypothetical protein